MARDLSQQMRLRLWVKSNVGLFTIIGIAKKLITKIDQKHPQAKRPESVRQGSVRHLAYPQDRFLAFKAL